MSPTRGCPECGSGTNLWLELPGGREVLASNVPFSAGVRGVDEHELRCPSCGWSEPVGPGGEPAGADAERGNQT